ncbi:MAG: PEP-CTERM sorting domain-containing protein [Nitrosomonas sp.]|nr:PEP-CTERM sorting domain-containing protein [Nitrosomonas sp.]
MQTLPKLLSLILFLFVSTFSIVAVKANPLLYPQMGSPNTQTYSFTAATTGEIGGYFLGSSADYTNTVSLLVNGVITPESSSGLFNNHTSNFGDYVVFGHANAGDVLTFQIKVADTGQTWSSDLSKNSDHLNHLFSKSYSGDADSSLLPAGAYLGFEDIQGGGDLDYNDEAFFVTNVNVSPVPEPETYAMLLIGLGLIFSFTKHSRKRITAQ